MQKHDNISHKKFEKYQGKELTYDKRSKQSIPKLHFVGDVFSDLFGTLGSKFEQEYRHDLSRLAKNDEHLLLLLKNHTSFIESTLNIVKNDHNSLQNHINQSKELNEILKNHTNTIENEEKIQNFLMYLTQIMNDYEKQQSAIIEVISDSKRKFISHELFTVPQIEKQVELISKQMGSEYHVPTGIEVYAVSTISVHRIKNQFVFKISIPLLNAQKYKLYRILQIPTIHDNKFDTKEIFLLASVNRQFYQFVNDITDCIPYGYQQVICDKPIHWFTSNKPNCIWDIFNHLPRENVTCLKPLRIHSS